MERQSGNPGPLTADPRDRRNILRWASCSSGVTTRSMCLATRWHWAARSRTLRRSRTTAPTPGCHGSPNPRHCSSSGTGWRCGGVASAAEDTSVIADVIAVTTCDNRRSRAARTVAGPHRVMSRAFVLLTFRASIVRIVAATRAVRGTARGRSSRRPPTNDCFVDATDRARDRERSWSFRSSSMFVAHVV